MRSDDIVMRIYSILIYVVLGARMEYLVHIFCSEHVSAQWWGHIVGKVY